MAAILATVDIEDLATPKIAGIKDALTDLVQTQQQAAAASGSMGSGMQGAIAAMGSMATNAQGAAQSVAGLAQTVGTVQPVVAGAMTGILQLTKAWEAQQIALNNQEAAIKAYASGLTTLSLAAISATLPIQAQAAAMADLAAGAKAGVPGLEQYATSLEEMAKQLQAGVPLTDAQRDALLSMSDAMVEANKATLQEKTAMQMLADEAAQLNAVIRENYQTLNLLTTQLTEGTKVTKVQSDALKELADRAKEGNGFTKEQADRLQQLSTALQAGATMTKAQAEELRKLTTEFAEANQAALGLRNEVEEDVGAFEKFKLAGAVVAGVLVELGAEALSYAKEAAQAAARAEVMGVVLQVVGKNAHQSGADMLEQVEVVRKLGITAGEATDAVIKFTQAELGAANASKLARVAQDLAVVAGINSSQAFERLTHAIEAQSVMMLRSFGIVTGLHTIYGEYARSVGKTADALSDQEKKQAFLNKVLEEGAKFTGTYEAAMEKAGKQFTSLDRLAEDFTETIGKGLLPAFNLWVKGLTELYEWFLKLPPAIQNVVSALLVFVSTMALFGGVLTGAKLIGLLELLTKIPAQAKLASAAFTAMRTGAVATGEAMTALGAEAVAGAGVAQSAWAAASAFFGGPWIAGLVLAGTAIAALTAAWVGYSAATTESTQDAVAQTAALQGDIDKINDTVTAIDTLAEAGLKTEDQQEAYNKKIQDLIRLVPNAVGAVNDLTHAYDLNRAAIDEVVKMLDDERRMRAEIAEGTIETTRKEVAAAKDLVDKLAGDFAAVAARRQAATAAGATAEAAALVELEKSTEAAYRDAQKKLTAKQAELAMSERLIASLHREANAENLAREARKAATTELETAAGGQAKLMADIQKFGLQKEYNKFLQENRVVNQKTMETAVITADEIMKAAKDLTSKLEHARAEAEKAAKQQAKQIETAAKGVRTAGTVDPVEAARYRELSKILSGLTPGTKEYNHQLELQGNLLNTFAKSAAFGTAEYEKLNEAVREANLNKYVRLDEPTIRSYDALAFVLKGVSGNTTEYNRVLAEAAPMLTKFTQMSDRQKASLGLTREEIEKAVAAYERLQQALALVTAKQKAQEDAQRAALKQQQELVVSRRQLAEEEEAAARKRAEDQIQANEAIWQSTKKLQDDINAARLEGAALQRYQIQRQIEDLQHAYAFTKAARDRALIEEQRASDAKVALMKTEAEERRQFALQDLQLTLDMLKKKAAAVRALAEVEKSDALKLEADKLDRQVQIEEATTSIARDGINARYQLEVGFADERKKVQDQIIAAQKAANAELDAAQKKLLEGQVANLKKQLADLQNGAAQLKKVYADLKDAAKQVADAFVDGLVEMVKGTKSFHDVLKSLWTSIKNMIIQMVADMVKSYLEGLIKMVTAKKAADLATSIPVVSGGGAAGGGGGAGDRVQGASGFVPGLVAGGPGQGGKVPLTGRQIAGGSIQAGAVGGLVGFGVGRGTGSYAGGIGAGVASGVAAGAQFGPVGMIVGGVAGLIGGWLGARKARQEAEKDRQEFIKSWSGGLEELKKKAAEAGASLDDLMKAKTPEKVAKAIEELNKKLALKEAKDGLAKTYDEMVALDKQAQLVGYDLQKLYNAKTIEEFNKEQEKLNKLLEEQQKRLEGLNNAAQGLSQWATGFTQTTQKKMKDLFPSVAAAEEFETKFKEAVDKGFKGTAKEFADKAKLALPMDEFMKAYQEAVDKGFKGTYAKFAENIQMPAEFIEKLKKITADTQKEFTALGTTAAATFAGVMKETGDVVQAMNAIAPTLDQLIDAQDKWGYAANGTFESLIKMRRMIKDNEDIYNSLGGITAALKGLSQAGALTQESFEQMGSVAVDKFNELVARTGDQKTAMVTMQPTLQALWEAQKKYGFKVDENTQSLIDQGVQQGIVGANMQAVDQKMLDVLGLIAQTLGVSKDKLDALGVAGDTAGGKVQTGFDKATTGAQTFATTAQGATDQITTDAEKARRKLDDLGDTAKTAGGDVAGSFSGSKEELEKLARAAKDAAEAATTPQERLKALADLARQQGQVVYESWGKVQNGIEETGKAADQAGGKIGTGMEDATQQTYDFQKSLDKLVLDMHTMKEKGEASGTGIGSGIEDAQKAMQDLTDKQLHDLIEKLKVSGSAGKDAGKDVKEGSVDATKGLDEIIRKAIEATKKLEEMGKAGVTAGQQIEGASTGAAEGHSPTGIKQIIARLRESTEATHDFADTFIQRAREVEAAGQFGTFAPKLPPPVEQPPEYLGKVNPATGELAGLVAHITVTQEGPTITVNALDNANMEEAWRNKILPEYLRHMNNNGDQIAERTEQALVRHRRRA